MHVRGRRLSAAGWFVLSACGGEEEEGRFFRLSHFFCVLASRLARLNCRRFLAGQFFLSGDVCCWAFVSRVLCASMGLGSKIVCFIDEKVVYQSVCVMK